MSFNCKIFKLTSNEETVSFYRLKDINKTNPLVLFGEGNQTDLQLRRAEKEYMGCEVTNSERQ